MLVTVQLASENHQVVTLTDRAIDAPLIVGVEDKAGYSQRVVLNVPKPS